MAEKGNIEQIRKAEILQTGPSPEIRNQNAQNTLEHTITDFQSQKDREYREKINGLEGKFTEIDTDYDTRNEQLTSAGDALRGATTASDHDTFLRVIEDQRGNLKNHRKTQEEDIALGFAKEGSEVTKEANMGEESWHEAMKLKRAPEELNKKGRLTQIGEKDPVLSEEDKKREDHIPERFRKKETLTMTEALKNKEKGSKEINAIREGKTKIDEGIYRERIYSPPSLRMATMVDNLAEDIRAKRSYEEQLKIPKTEPSPNPTPNIPVIASPDAHQNNQDKKDRLADLPNSVNT